MSLNNIQTALLINAQIVLEALNFPIAEENKLFDMQNKNKWASVFFLPNKQSSGNTIGLHGYDQMEGILQIDLNYILNTGTFDMREDFEAIKTMFRTGKRFGACPNEVIINSCGRDNGNLVDAFWRGIITIAWIAFIPRT